MRKRSILIPGYLVILSTIGLAFAEGKPPLRVVPEVDLNRYAGQWYEIARLPNRFQKGCIGSTAEYSLRENGEINVVCGAAKLS